MKSVQSWGTRLLPFHRRYRGLLGLGCIRVVMGPLHRLMDRLRVVPWDYIPHSSPQVFGKRVNAPHVNDFDGNLLSVY